MTNKYWCHPEPVEGRMLTKIVCHPELIEGLLSFICHPILFKTSALVVVPSLSKDDRIACHAKLVEGLGCSILNSVEQK
jgi:hypothetical protein